MKSPKMIYIQPARSESLTDFAATLERLFRNSFLNRWRQVHSGEWILRSLPTESLPPRTTGSGIPKSLDNTVMRHISIHKSHHRPSSKDTPLSLRPGCTAPVAKLQHDETGRSNKPDRPQIHGGRFKKEKKVLLRTQQHNPDANNRFRSYKCNKRECQLKRR